MHTRDKSQKCVKMVENVSWQPFLHIFDSYHMCACIIACCQLIFFFFWMPECIPGCQHLFSGLTTYFQLIFNYIQLFFSGFYLFPTILTSYLSILPIFDCLHLFSTIFTQIQVLPLFFSLFLYHFQSFSFIFCYIWPF